MQRVASCLKRIGPVSAGIMLPLILSPCMGGEIASAGTRLSPMERQEGAKAHPELVAEFGGAETGPRADYVASVTRNVAVQSGLSNAPGDFTVTLLNSSVNNAFAIPGGYVYVTRQLVALMNNEAELAGVMGHEVGHVAARHSARRQQAAQQNALLGVLGQVLSGVVFGDSALGQIGKEISGSVPQLATLRYSRSQETQADNLGIQYLVRAGYNPRAMGHVLESLAAQNALDAQLNGNTSATVPAWASTHPDPASRVQAAYTRAGASATGNVNADGFLSRINGVMYGDDPKQGMIEGRTFTHPEFRLTFEAPQGFSLMNGARAVSISGQSGKAQFSSAAYDGNLETYVRTVFNSLVGKGQALAPTQLERTAVNGIPAAFGVARASTSSGQVDVVVFVYDFGGNRAFHFAAIMAAGQAGGLNSLYRSMRRISAADAAAIKPRRVDVVTVRAGDTVASLAARMAFDDAKEARFRVLNGLTSGDRVSVGDKVKIVVRASS